MITSIVVLLMGIAGLLPGLTMATEPMWHAALKVLVGAYGGYVSYTDQP